MKLTADLIVLRDKKTGNFLEEIKNKPHALATGAVFVDELRGALTLPYKDYLRQKNKIKALAKVHGCEIIRVKVDYDLTYPNGAEVSEIECKKSPSLFDLIKDL